MRTKLFVENHWLGQARKIADIAGVQGKESFKIQDECAKEFMWYISEKVDEKQVRTRIDKYARLMKENYIEFDPYCIYRVEFLKWVLE